MRQKKSAARHPSTCQGSDMAKYRGIAPRTATEITAVSRRRGRAKNEPVTINTSATSATVSDALCPVNQLREDSESCCTSMPSGVSHDLAVSQLSFILPFSSNPVARIPRNQKPAKCLITNDAGERRHPHLRCGVPDYPNHNATSNRPKQYEPKKIDTLSL